MVIGRQEEGSNKVQDLLGGYCSSPLCLHMPSQSAFSLVVHFSAPYLCKCVIRFSICQSGAHHMSAVCQQRSVFVLDLSLHVTNRSSSESLPQILKSFLTERKSGADCTTGSAHVYTELQAITSPVIEICAQA